MQSSLTQRAALYLAHSANQKLRPIDQMLFAPTNIFSIDPVFVVGVPRSGTTLLYQALTHSLQVMYLPRILDYGYGLSHFTFRTLSNSLERHEPVFASKVGVTKGLLSPSESFGFWRRWFWSNNTQDHENTHPLSHSQATDMRKAVYAIASHRNVPLLVKCLYLALSIRPLAQAFPNAKFIFITRDPIDIGASILGNRPPHETKCWWSIKPAGYKNLLTAAPQDQVMWQVARTASRIRDALSSLPQDRWRVVSYESFCENPTKIIFELADWLEQLGVTPWPSNLLPNRFTRQKKTDAFTAKRISLLRESIYYPDAKIAFK